MPRSAINLPERGIELHHPIAVLSIDHGATMTPHLAGFLTRSGCLVLRVTETDSGLRVLKTIRFDVVLVHLGSPAASPSAALILAALLAGLRSRLGDSPAIVVLPRERLREKERAVLSQYGASIHPPSGNHSRLLTRIVVR